MSSSISNNSRPSAPQETAASRGREDKGPAPGTDQMRMAAGSALAAHAEPAAPQDRSCFTRAVGVFRSLLSPSEGGVRSDLRILLDKVHYVPVALAGAWVDGPRGAVAGVVGQVVFEPLIRNVLARRAAQPVVGPAAAVPPQPHVAAALVHPQPGPAAPLAESDDDDEPHAPMDHTEIDAALRNTRAAVEALNLHEAPEPAPVLPPDDPLPAVVPHPPVADQPPVVPVLGLSRRALPDEKGHPRTHEG
jgi:hypothetical protein